jgi:hypothetical protein
MVLTPPPRVRRLVRQRRARTGRRASPRRSAGYRRLPSGARSRGPSPNSLRLLRSATFKQAATSQFTKRAARAGHEPCAPQACAGRAGPVARPLARHSQSTGLSESGLGLRGALRPVRAHLCGNVFGVRWNSQHDGAKRDDSCSSWQTPNGGSAVGGTRQGRFLGRRGAQGQGRRAQRASTTDSRALFERNERSECSEFDRATLDRAPQRSRRTRRPPRHEPLPGAACRAALTGEVGGTH